MTPGNNPVELYRHHASCVLQKRKPRLRHEITCTESQSQWVMEQGFKPKQEDSRTLMSSNGSSQLLPAPTLDVWTPLVFTLQKR